jgi:hypothetical protein
VKTGLQDRLRRPQPERVAPDTGPMTGSISNQHPSTIRGRPSPQPSDVSRVRRDLAVDRDWWRRRRRRHSGGSPRQHVSRHYGASEARARQRTTVGEMAGERPASGWKRMRAEIGSWFERWPYEEPRAASIQTAKSARRGLDLRRGGTRNGRKSATNIAMRWAEEALGIGSSDHDRCESWTSLMMQRHSAKPQAPLGH